MNNHVDFGKNLKSVKIKALSTAGGIADIFIDKIEGRSVARVKINKNGGWKIYESELFEIPSGIHNLIVKLSAESNIEIDWVQFE